MCSSSEDKGVPLRSEYSDRINHPPCFLINIFIEPDPGLPIKLLHPGQSVNMMDGFIT